MGEARTFVSWLGVTQYLTQDAVATTLDWVSQLSTGSEIVLTFVVPSPEAETEKEQHATRGTRFETFFAPEQMAQVIRQAGLPRRCSHQKRLMRCTSKTATMACAPPRVSG